MRTLVFPLVTYACETWTMKARERARIEAFEMYTWRSLLSLHWAQHRTNASVLLDMGPHRGGDLLQFINTMQLRYFGHVARRDNNNLEKNCMLGMMEGEEGRVCDGPTVSRSSLEKEHCTRRYLMHRGGMSGTWSLQIATSSRPRLND